MSSMPTYVDPDPPQPAAEPPVVEPTVVEPPTAAQMTAFIITIRRLAPLSPRRVIELIDEFFLHYYPDGVPEPEPPAPVTATVEVSSPELLALDTAPKSLVSGDGPNSLEFVGAEATLNFGTVPYVDALGTVVLRIMCGSTPVSDDVPSTFLTGSATDTVTFVPKAGQTPQPFMPLVLDLFGGPVTGGDSTLSVEITSKSIPSDPATAQSGLPPYKFGVA